MNGGANSGRIATLRKKRAPGTSGRVRAKAKINPASVAVVVEMTIITRLLRAACIHRRLPGISR